MKTAASLLLALALMLCLPCAAFATTPELQTGTVAVDTQGVSGIPGKVALSRFKSGAAGRMYAVATKKAGIAGYEFQVALDKRFKVGLRKKTIKTNSTVFLGLTGKKRYYGRVRAYSIVGGKVVWGPWSVIKSAEVTQAIIAVARGGTSGNAKRWIARGGAKVVTINSANVDPSKYDGLVLPGGGDVDPALYGAKPNSRCFGIDRKLDVFQINVTLKFARAGKPVMGLCRGAQVINVAFGGTLYQHIKGWYKGSRTVKIAKGSLLYNIFNATESTSHSHNECALKLGKGLKATQWDAKDGHIEAIEHTVYPVYGLQWHPENMGTRGTNVAKKFLAICSIYSSPRSSATA